LPGESGERRVSTAKGDLSGENLSTGVISRSSEGGLVYSLWPVRRDGRGKAFHQLHHRKMFPLDLLPQLGWEKYVCMPGDGLGCP